MKRYLKIIAALIFFVFINDINAQFEQQGDKLIGSGAVGSYIYQGYSVSISSDGNTAVVGGYYDNNGQGAVWIFTRLNGVWTQQGNKLIGTGPIGRAFQGWSVSVSSDGNTAILGGVNDNNSLGAAWIFTRQNGVWTQQGSKLIGSGAVGSYIYQGCSVSISADGNTAIIGGYGDNNGKGAVWIFTRQNGVWSQQGGKLVGSGAIGSAYQGRSVSISSDGNTAIVGGIMDNNWRGAVWVFIRQNGIWSQQGSKLIGTDAVGNSELGSSVSISSDGNTAIAGGNGDNSRIGAAWIFTRQNGVWTQQGSKLIGSGAVGSYIYQGCSVSISADGNTAIIGGSNDDALKGAAWIFTRVNGAWTQQGSKLIGSGAVGNANQGWSVSISSDGNTIISGGNFDNSTKGAAWVFVRSTYTISANAGSGGIISPNGNVTVYYGDNKTFTITPNAGYHTSGVTVDGTPVNDSVKSYTFSNIKANHTIQVTFAPDAVAGVPIPVISYPTGGITVYTTAPIVSWYITGYYAGARYHLQVSESPNFNTITYQKDDINGIQAEVPGLIGGKIYYIRVRLKTVDNLYGYYSSVESFKVNEAGTIPVAPVISYPTNGTTVYVSNPTVTWYIPQQAPAQKYQLQLSLSNDFTNPVLNAASIDGLTYQLSGLTGGATYYLRIRSFTSTGSYSAYSSVVSFNVNTGTGTQAVIPVISYPTGGITIYTTSTYINWYISSYQPTQKYNLQLSTRQDFATLVLNQDNISAIQYQVTGLTPGMTYYIRVRGKALDGSYSLFSSVQWFTVSAGSYSVAVPIAANPSGDVEITSGSALLSWYTPSGSSSSQKYELEYSTTKDFQNANRVTDIDSRSYILSDLKSNTRYFWRVRSTTKDGKISQYSSEGTFVTSRNEVIQKDNLTPKDYALSQNYPNPFNPSTTIEFSLVKQIEVSLIIYDVLGKVLEPVIQAVVMYPGSYRVEWNAAKYPSGIYFYRITAGSYTEVRKMVLIR